MAIAHTSGAVSRAENPVLGALDRAASAVADAVANRLAASSWATAESGYRQLLEALGVAVYTTDADGRVTYFNDAAAAFWGRRPELGELWCGSYRLFWPDGQPMAHAECPMAIALIDGRGATGRRGDRRAARRQPHGRSRRTRPSCATRTGPSSAR